MKFIHLADLHLGKTINTASMLEDQQYILAQIIGHIKKEQPDIVLIAGDVYDRAIPPAQAISLLDSFLHELVIELHTQVVLIPGNHDSNDRLGFASRLLKNNGLYIASSIEDVYTPVHCKDMFGNVSIYTIPFLQPFSIKNYFDNDDTIKNYDTAYKRLIESIPLVSGERRIMVCHAFITGAETTGDSELPLSVGGSEEISNAYFAPFHYTALGHLHKPQKAGDSMFYAGSPLKYSFAETAHHKSLICGTIDENGTVNIQQVPLSPLRDLRIIEGNFEEIIKNGSEDKRRNDYIKVKLLDDGMIFDPVNRLREVYPNLIDFEFVRFSVTHDHAIKGIGKSRTQMSMADIFGNFYQEMTGEVFTDEYNAVFEELYKEFTEKEHL